MSASPEARHEIIIVRRGHDDHDDAHHGGVWKIAFADFMTAMMCFFLVMWLINAANEDTRAAVASYFNPVKLVDRNSSKRGLEDIGDGPSSAGSAAPDSKADDGDKAAEGAEGKSGAGSAEVENHSEEQLFAEPYAVLAEIAGDTGMRQNVSAKGDGGARDAGPSTGASGGESYRDPFAPDFWSQQVAASDTAMAARTAEPAAGESPGGVAEPKDARAEADTVEAEATRQAEVGASTKPGPPAAEDAAQPAADRIEKAPRAEPPEASAEALKAAEEIRRELAQAFQGERMAEGVTVVAGERGVTISVTDQLDFGMFEIGSALPRRETVLAMERIAAVVNARKGSLTVAGHTDGRPFRSEAYDNWRLSTARAHAAYYMLVRTGLDERRITEVSGFADRRLKDPAHPFAASNRRIEIMLDVGG